MHKIVLLSATLSAVLSALAAQAVPTEPPGSYCAFEITVRSPDGSPVGLVPVFAAQRGSQFARTSTDAAGIARICDVPGEQIDIEVGPPRHCGTVHVRDLIPDWLETFHVLVTYRTCGRPEFIPPTGCLITLRVKDSQSRPVLGAVLDAPSASPSVFRQTQVSDEYGRIFRYVKEGETVDARLTKEGYVPVDFTYACKSTFPERQEHEVVIEHVKGRPQY